MHPGSSESMVNMMNPSPVVGIFGQMGGEQSTGHTAFAIASMKLAEVVWMKLAGLIEASKGKA